MRVIPFNQIRTKVMVSIGFLAVFGLMLLIAFMSINTLNRVNRSMADLIHNSEQKTAHAYHMRDAIRLRTSEVRAMALTSEPDARQKIYTKLEQSTQNYKAAQVELESMAANTREREILTKISAADIRSVQAYDKAGSRLFGKVHEDTDVVAAIGNVQLHDLVLLNHLNDLVQLQQELSTEALDESQANYKKTRGILVASVIAAFAVSIIICAAVFGRVSRANRRITHLANHDDLTGLKNRRVFDTLLVEKIEAAGQSGNSNHHIPAWR